MPRIIDETNKTSLLSTDYFITDNSTSGSGKVSFDVLSNAVISNANLGNTYATKSSAVTNVSYDSTNAKFIKTINGSSSDIITVAALKQLINTDTHHTAKLVIGGSNTATSNATASNGNVYLNLIENSTVRSFNNIKGSGSISVTSDANGSITISGTSTAGGTVTSVETGTGLSGGTITTSGTISLADYYGDTKNPYASKTAGYVLAAPSVADGAPSFRSLTSYDIKPEQTKTYTSVVASANNDPNGWLYFGKFVPTGTTDLVYIKYRIRAEAAGTSLSYNDSIVECWTRSNSVVGYRIFNQIKHNDYRAFYNHSVYRAKDAGITGGYGHIFGLRFYSSWNPTTAANARTVIIDILETRNCTVSFFDSPLKYAEVSGTGTTNFDGRTDWDGTTNGWTFSGDRNDPSYQNRECYGARTTTAAMYRYIFCFSKPDGRIVPVHSLNNDVTTTKTLTTDTFDPFGDIFYWSSTTSYAAGANVGDSYWFRQHQLADLRYSFNCGGYQETSTLTGRQPLYLVVSPQLDGLVKLHSDPLSQTLPSTEDGLLYIYLGRVYPDTKPYRLSLTPRHPIYWYKNGVVRQYSGDAATVNGLTIQTAVPSGAKFTDANVTNTLSTSTKFYITGTSSATTNTGTQYFDTGVYVNTTAGELVATTMKVGAGTDYTTSKVRNIILSDTTPLDSVGSNGDICIIYS